MSDIPSDLHYRDSHEWVRVEDDGSVVVGITDHAQAALGDIVFVELPEPGLSYAQGDACAVIESVKAASDIYAPISGEVIEANPALEDDPALVNSDPYGDGWLFSLAPSAADEISSLMDSEGYAESIEE
ncbi:glycine cleavage system protein GcvH [Elongatibacter sediminis]|uniref:Glycine cleavage system H protein n=1 Tax=Elongatibacter sediminis TaxID=3119006 RepID=A0AAW9RLX0_9GAMM